MSRPQRLRESKERRLAAVGVPITLNEFDQSGFFRAGEMAVHRRASRLMFRKLNFCCKILRGG